MDKDILIPITNGSEELEFTIITNLLRRANYKVILAADDDIVTGARGMKIIPDKLIDNINLNDEWDAIILPGGIKGVEGLGKIHQLEKLLIKQNDSKKMIGAICAAPLLLKEFKLIKSGFTLTSHPSVRNDFRDFNYLIETVLVYENFITSRGIGTGIDFSLKIIELLSSKELSNKIALEIVYNQ